MFVLTFENDGITSEYLEFVHFGLGHLNNRVVILFRIFDLELVGRLFAIHDRSRIVLFSSIERQANILSRTTGSNRKRKTYPSPGVAAAADSYGSTIRF